MVLSQVIVWRLCLVVLLLVPIAALSTPNLTRKQPFEFVWNRSQVLGKWYTDWELCVLNSNENVTNVVVSARECAKRKVFLMCHLGDNYHKRPCIMRNIKIADEMPHFFMAMEGYDDPDQRYMEGVLRSLAQHNGSLVVVGDSTVNLFAKAATCELRREGVLPDPDPMFREVVPSVGVLARPGDAAPTYVPFQFLMTAKMNADLLQRAEAAIYQQLTERDTVMVVINTGLWYNTPTAYKWGADAMFKSLLLLAERVESGELGDKVLLLGVLETVAQHYNAPLGSGYYQGEKIPASVPCSAISNHTWASDYRNDIMWRDFVQADWGRRVAEMKRVAFTVLPARAVTESLSDHHMHHDAHDCTHFCYTPMLYQPVYSQMEQLAATVSDLWGAVRKGERSAAPADAPAASAVVGAEGRAGGAAAPGAVAAAGATTKRWR